MRLSFFPNAAMVVFSMSFLLGFGEDAVCQEAATVLDRVTNDIKYLASDELGGRKPGTEGIEKAAKYIEDLFESAGLKKLENGTYRQDFEVREGFKLDMEATNMKLTGADGNAMELELGKEFMSQATRRPVELDAELVFAGYGINAEDLNYNDYRDIDANGKVVVVIRREPQQKDPNSVFDGTDVSAHSYIRAKTTAAQQAGAVGLIMVNDGVNATDDEKDVLEDPTRFGGRFPFVQMKRSVFNKLLSSTPLLNSDGEKLSTLAEIESLIDETLSPISQPLTGWKVTCNSVGKQSMAKTSNIVGIIEGEGPNADETLVIGGHYDHLGMGGRGSRSNLRAVHNGADDNATGTAAVMELARRYGARDKKPARRLMFIAFTAEEMGLLGAKYYVDDDPIFDLQKTAAMVNFDMIGWLRDDKLTVYSANSGNEFDELLDRANTDFGMDVVKSSRAGGSDQQMFYNKRIPVMFLHTGLTTTYHTPEDDFETIDCVGAVRVIDYSEKVIDEILALPSKPTFHRADRSASSIRLGVALNDDIENGVEITGVSEGSIAERNGFEVGDIITSIDDDAVTRRREIVLKLRAKAGEKVPFKLRRGEKVIEKQVELKMAG